MNSTTSHDTSTVRTSVTVNAPRERAFELFTDGIEKWWPKEHHILQAPLAGMTFERRVGGNIIDRGTDGSECRWARVLAFDPPHLIVFSWDIGLDWQIQADASKTSEVEVRFVAEGDTTRVSLTHRHIDRHGMGWEKMRDSVASDDGWGLGLRRFKSVAESN